MAESGTYDYATIQRRQKIAEQMLAESSKPQQIQHWAQGLAQLGNIGADTYRLNQLEKQAAEARKADMAAMMSVLGGGTPAAAPAAPAAATPPAPSPAGDYSGRVITAESGGDPSAKNPLSTSAGPAGFIDSTWLETIKKARPDLAAGKDDATLLAMRSDPALSKDMTDFYATGNRKYLADRGLPVTPGATYLAHFAGPGGAQKVLSADPKAQIASLLSPDAIKANPFLRNMTAGDLTAWADRKMGGSPAAPLAPAPAVIGQGGAAKPDAEGVFPADAVMLPTDMSAQSRASAAPPIPSGAMSVPGTMPAAPAAAPAPTAPPAFTPGGIPANRRADIARLLSTTPGSPAHTMGMAILQKTVAGEKEDVRPMTEAERQQWQVPAGMSAGIDRNTGKPTFSPAQTNVAVNSVADPIREGIGKSFNANRDKALTAAREVIPSMHDARTALDQGVFSGAAGDVKLALQKIGGVFGVPAKEAENTEVFRAAIGKQVLGHIKALGANPSNADREFINSIEGGKGTLEEGTLRRLLDIGEKYARQSIRNHNTDAEKLMKVQPDAYKGVAPIMSVEEPAEYVKPKDPAAATTPPTAAPAGKVPTYDPKTGKWS